MNDYSLAEFDILSSFIYGGEYYGFCIGSYCLTKEQTVIKIVGFAQEYIDFADLQVEESEENVVEEDKKQQEDLETIVEKCKNVHEIDKKHQFIVGIYVEDDNPYKGQYICHTSDELMVTNNPVYKSNDYLIEKGRMNSLNIKLDELPDKSDPESLTRKCVWMKILVTLFSTHASKIPNIIEDSLRNSLVNFLLQECSIPE
jgi:hypothetical protein